MPKRLCPFADEFLPQSKTFVTEKKVNCGVAQDERLIAVHAKTRQLLFRAAANKCQCNKKSVHPIDKKETQDILCVYCENEESYNEKKMKEVCQICRRPSQNKCNYCDKLLCSDCGMCCYNCGLIFCKHCCCNIFIGEMDNGIVCFSCFK